MKLNGIRLLGRAKGPKQKLIPVWPKNLRRIALYAVSVAGDPVILVDGHSVSDLSEAGPLTRREIRSCRDFEVRDGASPILGFHDHPNEMWISEAYAPIAHHCAGQGWLKIQGPAS